jgi:hypothetical protein
MHAPKQSLPRLACKPFPWSVAMLQVITFSHSDGMLVKRHADINILHILKLNPHWKKRDTPDFHDKYDKCKD